MLRIQWHTIPDNKSLWIGLTMIYGVWRSTSKTLLDKLGISVYKKVKDLSDDEQKAITDEIKLLLLENDLKRKVIGSIKRLKEIKCYRGMRHNLWLPVRWQQTRKNAKTAKKLLWRSKVRPVLKK